MTRDVIPLMDLHQATIQYISGVRDEHLALADQLHQIGNFQKDFVCRQRARALDEALAILKECRPEPEVPLPPLVALMVQDIQEKEPGAEIEILHISEG